MALDHQIIEDKDKAKFITALDTQSGEGWDAKYESFSKQTQKNGTAAIYTIVMTKTTE